MWSTELQLYMYNTGHKQHNIRRIGNLYTCRWHTVLTSVSLFADSTVVVSTLPLTTTGSSFLLLAFDEVLDFSSASCCCSSCSCFATSFSLSSLSLVALCCWAFTFQTGVCSYNIITHNNTVLNLIERTKKTRDFLVKVVNHSYDMRICEMLISYVKLDHMFY